MKLLVELTGGQHLSDISNRFMTRPLGITHTSLKVPLKHRGGKTGVIGSNLLPQSRYFGSILIKLQYSDVKRSSVESPFTISVAIHLTEIEAFRHLSYLMETFKRKVALQKVLKINFHNIIQKLR